MGILFAGRYWMGMGGEIGEGGASFHLGQNLPEGKDIVINFQIPGGGFVSVQSEIKNVRKDATTGLVIYGVSFKTLKFEAKREIRAFVSTRVEAES
jgi:hypothetical protein